MNDVNGRCMPPDDPSNVPAIDEVLGNSPEDRRIRLIAEMARALGIKSLDQAAAELARLRAAEKAVEEVDPTAEIEDKEVLPPVPCAEEKW